MLRNICCIQVSLERWEGILGQACNAAGRNGVGCRAHKLYRGTATKNHFFFLFVTPLPFLTPTCHPEPLHTPPPPSISLLSLLACLATTCLNLCPDSARMLECIQGREMAWEGSWQSGVKQTLLEAWLYWAVRPQATQSLWASVRSSITEEELKVPSS